MKSLIYQQDSHFQRKNSETYMRVPIEQAAFTIISFLFIEFHLLDIQLNYGINRCPGDFHGGWGSLDNLYKNLKNVNILGENIVKNMKNVL